MRKTAIVVLSALLLAPPAAHAAGWSTEVPVMADGGYREPLAAYKVGSDYYLDSKEAGALYGAQVYWYPVSGRVQMSLRGKQAQFLVNSDTVKLGDKEVKLSAPVMPRASYAYIPLSFFLSKEFSAWAGADSSFNAETGLLTVDKRSTVGAVRWFSYAGYTRLVFELGPGLSYMSAGRGLKGFELSVVLGSIGSSEAAEISDGIVEGYSLRQGPNMAKLSVRLAQAGLHWRVKELDKPRRIVLDFYAGDEPREVVKAAARPTPAPAPVPAKVERTPQPSKPDVRPASAPARKRIVVDAGHGGKDGGATGARGTLEKNINLLAAQELAALLKEEGSFDVVLTRDNDTFVPLSERSRIANEYGADLFISMHCNASRKPRDEGFEVYFLSEKASDPAAARIADFENSVVALEGKSPQDEEAAFLLKEMTKTENINAGSEAAALMVRALGKRVDFQNRGVKQAAFYVLRGTYAPAVLVEMAYISNKKDEARLESKKYRRRVIDGVYEGVLDFAKREGWTAAASD